MSESIQNGEKDKFDTREKLEADAIALQKRIWKAGSEHGAISICHLFDLLDRQAAIARAECQKVSENVADWEDSCDTREILEHDCKWMAYAWAPAEYPDDKLEKKLYREIIEKLDRQAAITRAEDERICDTCRDEQVEALQEQVDELEAENARLREKLSQALDHAHSISKLGELD